MNRQTIRYQPALDGVRALAVAAVLLFHGGVSWMSGGYLGVSVFFTLSGFLITSLLLVEHERSGTVSARAFYARRAKRLLPASLTCLVGVCVMSALGWFRGVSNIRRDVFGALFQVFNWVKLFAGESYADLTTLHSGFRKPLEHYWSLAIEEQFYWIWPVAFLGIMVWAKRSQWRPISIVAGLTAVFAVAAPVIARVWGPDAAYWATPARISEILAGALLACWVSGRELRAALRWLAPAALLALAAACVLFPTGHGPAYQGALPLVAVASAGLILGLQVDGPVRRVLSTRPLVGLGRISYGVYLYHWPVFVLIDRHDWHLPVGVLLLIKVSITLTVALASYHLIERPVRMAESLVPRRVLAGAAVGTVAVVVGAVTMVPVTSAYYTVDGHTAQEAGFGTESVAPLLPSTTTTALTTTTSTPTTASPGAASSTSTSSTTSTTTTTALPTPPRPVRIVVVGDSTAEATGAGLVQWAAAHPTLAKVELVTGPGCGIVTGGYFVLGGSTYDVDAHCRLYLSGILPQKVKALHPDVVMVMTTSWDVADRKLTRSGPLLPPTDPAIVAATQRSFRFLTDELLGFGVSRVVWVHQPIPVASLLGPADPQAEPARHEMLYHVMDALAAADHAVRVADLAGWVDAHGLAEDTKARPDGVHWTLSVSDRIATDFLGPDLVREALT